MRSPFLWNVDDLFHLEGQQPFRLWLISSLDRNDVPAVLGEVVLVERIDPAVLNSVLPLERSCRVVWLASGWIGWAGPGLSGGVLRSFSVPRSDY